MVALIIEIHPVLTEQLKISVAIFVSKKESSRNNLLCVISKCEFSRYMILSHWTQKMI
jgi:hypothetical protein